MDFIFRNDLSSIQAGQYNDAYELLEERRNIEEDQLGSRADEMADIYQLMAKCKSEVSAKKVVLFK